MTAGIFRLPALRYLIAAFAGAAAVFAIFYDQINVMQAAHKHRIISTRRHIDILTTARAGKPDHSRIRMALDLARDRGETLDVKESDIKDCDILNAIRSSRMPLRAEKDVIDHIFAYASENPFLESSLFDLLVLISNHHEMIFFKMAHALSELRGSQDSQRRNDIAARIFRKLTRSGDPNIGRLYQLDASEIDLVALIFDTLVNDYDDEILGWGLAGMHHLIRFMKIEDPGIRGLIKHTISRRLQQEGNSEKAIIACQAVLSILTREKNPDLPSRLPLGEILVSPMIYQDAGITVDF